MTTIGEQLRETARAATHRPALLAGPDLQLTFGQVESLAERLLEAVGGRTPATIAIHTTDRLALASLVTAGLIAGCVVCPLNPANTTPVMGTLLGHAQPQLLVTDDPASGAVGALGLNAVYREGLFQDLHESSTTALPTSAAGGLLVYTSGTTGDPKAVLLDETHLGANVAFAIDHFGYRSDWITASVLPLFHTFTLVSDLLPMLVCGGRTLITPGAAMQDLEATTRAMAAAQVCSYSAVPIVFDTLMALRLPLPDSLRFAVAGAAPLTNRTQARYLATYGHPILPCYGLTESTCFAAASAPGDIREAAVGKPAGIEIAVVDDAGTAVRAAVSGEIALRGASVVSTGYHKDDGRHGAAFTTDGWFLTGDLGHLDRDGFLYVTGRKKNMLIRGGEKVYLEDVDRCLSTHAAVADSCTIRVESAGGHEDRAVTFVVWTTAAIDASEIIGHVTALLGPLAAPDRVESIAEVPRSPSGKVLREVLRRRYESTR